MRFEPASPLPRLRKIRPLAILISQFLVMLLLNPPAHAQSLDNNHKLAKSEQARQVLIEALKWALLMPTHPEGWGNPRESLVAQIGGTQALAGYPEEALETAKHLTPSFRGSLSHEISAAFVRQGDFERALKLAIEVEAFCLANRVMHCNSQATRLRIMKEKLRRGDLSGANEMGFPEAMVAHERGLQEAEAGNLQAAFSIWEQVSGSWSKDQILMAIIHSQEIAGDHAGAFRTAALLTAKGNDRPQAEAQIRGSLIDAAIRDGDWETAHGNASLMPAGLLFETLLKVAVAQGKAGLIGEAILAFEQAAEKVRSHSRQGIDPRYVGPMWGQIVSAELRAGLHPAHLVEAEAFYEATGESGVWCPIGAAQARMGDLASARATQRRAGDDLWCVFAVIAQLEAQSGNVEGAIHTLLTSAWEPQRRFALFELVKSLVSSGNVSEARLVADRLALMENGLPTDAAATDNVSSATRLSDEEQAEQQEAEARYSPDAAQLVSRTLVKAGHPDEALRWARSRPNPHSIAMALLGVAQGLTGMEGDVRLLP